MLLIRDDQQLKRKAAEQAAIDKTKKQYHGPIEVLPPQPIYSDMKQITAREREEMLQKIHKKAMHKRWSDGTTHKQDLTHEK